MPGQKNKDDQTFRWIVKQIQLNGKLDSSLIFGQLEVARSLRPILFTLKTSRATNVAQFHSCIYFLNRIWKILIDTCRRSTRTTESFDRIFRYACIESVTLHITIFDYEFAFHFFLSGAKSSQTTRPATDYEIRHSNYRELPALSGLNVRPLQM